MIGWTGGSGVGRGVVALVLGTMACSAPPSAEHRPDFGTPVGTSGLGAKPAAGPGDRAAGYVAVVIAPQAIDLATPVPGILHASNFALGDVVTEGAGLAQVQIPTLDADIEAARAAVAQADAAAAEQRLVVQDAREQLTREQQLMNRGANTIHAVQQARLLAKRAEAVAGQRVAERAERRATLDRLHAQREAGQIVAPFTGTVAAWYQPPESVVASGDRLLRLTQTDQLWVRIAVPVADLAGIAVQQPVDVIPAAPGRPVRATIRHIAPELDLASQMMLVEAQLPEHTDLRPGQACRVRFTARLAATAPSMTAFVPVTATASVTDPLP